MQFLWGSEKVLLAEVQINQQIWIDAVLATSYEMFCFFVVVDFVLFCFFCFVFFFSFDMCEQQKPRSACATNLINFRSAYQ